jgi:hypothetical protein
MKWIKKPLYCLAMMLFGALAMLAFGYLFMRLWNWLIPELFHGPILNFWQGIGLLVLFKILFGHHGRGGKCAKKKCCRCSCSKEDDSCSSNEGWSRWKNMSWSDKQEMKQNWKEKCKDWANEYKTKSNIDTNSEDNEKI